MAVDVRLLEEVVAVTTGTGAARAALSLGRFQPDADVDRAACGALGVDVVRRPTGGRALLHGGDLTYAVALPRPAGRAGTVAAVYELVAGALRAGLARLGVDARIASNDGPFGPVCFAGRQGSDLRVGDRKLCGSAQVHRDGGVLQHGSILLRRLAFDETALVRDGGSEASKRLRASTVTLEELGVPHDARVVADGVIAGFARCLRVAWLR